MMTVLKLDEQSKERESESFQSIATKPIIGDEEFSHETRRKKCRLSEHQRE